MTYKPPVKCDLCDLEIFDDDPTVWNEVGDLFHESCWEDEERAAFEYRGGVA